MKQKNFRPVIGRKYIAVVKPPVTSYSSMHVSTASFICVPINGGKPSELIPNTASYYFHARYLFQFLQLGSDFLIFPTCIRLTPSLIRFAFWIYRTVFVHIFTSFYNFLHYSENSHFRQDLLLRLSRHFLLFFFL